MICIAHHREVAELEAIAETLRQRRKDLEDLMDDSDSRRIKTTELLARIEDLRRRVEESQKRFGDSVTQSGSS